MKPTRQIVITGVGVVSPIGIGNEPFWKSLCEGRSGVRGLGLFESDDLPAAIGAEVHDLHPEAYVRPRKALKVMCRDIQLAFVAADLACRDARLHSSPVDPERLGIVFGADMMTCELEDLFGAYRSCMVDGRFDFGRWGTRALAEMYPLWMLKYLPNMSACHIGIAHDARGPNNTLTLAEVSSLAAIAEAARVVERGQADCMIAGGSGSRVHPAVWAWHNVHAPSQRRHDPPRACRPFDAGRDGMVHGEGAGAFIVEEREHAEARKAAILARLLGHAAAFEPPRGNEPTRGVAIRAAIRAALTCAKLQPTDVGHVNAHGLSTRLDDRIEAQAIRDTLGDVPVTAPKSFFGNLSAGTGAVEAAASVLAFQYDLVPPTLNYERADPECPINVVHGQPMQISQPTALLLNHSQAGQAIAMILAAAD